MLNWTVEMERQMMLEASKRMPQEEKEKYLRIQGATPEQMAAALELHQAKITYLQGRKKS